jgi:hypothetical protein
MKNIAIGKGIGVIVVLGTIGYYCGAPSGGYIQEMNERPEPEPEFYMINVDTAGYNLTAGDRLVHRFVWGDNPKLDSIILKDNE